MSGVWNVGATWRKWINTSWEKATAFESVKSSSLYFRICVNNLMIMKIMSLQSLKEFLWFLNGIIIKTSFCSVRHQFSWNCNYFCWQVRFKIYNSGFIITGRLETFRLIKSIIIIISGIVLFCSGVILCSINPWRAVSVKLWVFKYTISLFLNTWGLQKIIFWNSVLFKLGIIQIALL